jgi:Raf kinase inhibitor-like YbhB/YbcL family protein
MTKPAASPASAPAKLSLSTTAFADGKPIPAKYAYGMPDGYGRVKDGGNINPELRWSGAPEGTKSYVLIVVDPDVPATFDDANQPGKTIPESYPRQNFYHWVLFDIPVSVTSIAEGQDSQKVIAGGKPVDKLAYGITGPNDYSKFGGTHGGYDGCCPPWNDERLHHYHFVIYALDVPSLGLSGAISGKVVEDAIKGHVLAKAEIVGTYTNNQKLLGR